jgi:hypothetical protein
MALTFRQIGARQNIQGGTSFRNLSVNKQLSLTEPFIIVGNNPLYLQVSIALQSHTLLIDNISFNIEPIILNEPLNLDSIVDLVKPNIVNSIVSSTTFTDNIIAQQFSGPSSFAPTGKNLLINSLSFLNEISAKLAPSGVYLILHTIQTTLLTTLKNSLVNYVIFQHTVLENLQPFIFKISQTPELNVLTRKRRFTQQYTVSIAHLELKQVSMINRGFGELLSIYFKPYLFTCLSGTNLVRLVVTLRLQNNALLKTVLDTTYSPAVPSVTIDFNTVYYNSIYGSQEDVYLCFFVELDTGFGTITGAGFIEVIRSKFVQDMVYFDNSITFPMIVPSSSSLTKLYSFNKELKSTIPLPYSTYNGIVQYNNGYPLWYSKLQYCTNVVTVRGDTSTYIACNAIGPATINTSPTPTVNSFNSIILFKFKEDGTVLWNVKLYSLTTSYQTLSGVVTDVDGNIYVYGTHLGNALYAYNEDGTRYDTIISETSLIANYGNTFIVKYSGSGVVLGFSTIKSSSFIQINSLYVEEISKVVYIVGTSVSESYPEVRTFKNSNEIFLPTHARGFCMQLQNVGSSISDTREFYNVAAVVNTDPYIIIPAEVSCLKVIPKNLGSIYQNYTLILCKIKHTAATFLGFFYSTTGADPPYVNGNKELFFNGFDYTSDDVNKTILVLWRANSDMYISTPGYIKNFWYMTFRSDNLIDDGCQQLVCSVQHNSMFISVRTGSTLNFTLTIKDNFIRNVVLPLPSNFINATFILSVSTTWFYYGYIAISNSKINNMYVDELTSTLYISYSFENVSTLDNNNLQIISIGEDRKKGNALVRVEIGGGVFRNEKLIGYSYE